MMDYCAQWTELDNQRHKYVHRWQAGPNHKATICIIHGLGEHGGRYQSLAQHFVQAGFRVLAFDQQGHGKSDEPRGCVQSYASMLDDIEAFLEFARGDRLAPVVLFGHSMGGNLALNYALRKPNLPTRIISSSPMIRAVSQPGWLMLKILRSLMLVLPNYRLRSQIVPAGLMSDPLEQAALRQDELFHSQLSLRLGAALIDSGAWALKNAQLLSAPMLITHGTGDIRTCHRASEEFAKQAGRECQLEILADQLHDPFRGLEKEHVIRKFVDFANASVSEYQV